MNKLNRNGKRISQQMKSDGLMFLDNIACTVIELKFNRAMSNMQNVFLKMYEWLISDDNV